MNKKIIIVTLALIVTSVIILKAQKVKYKDEQVLVDKEHKFDFVKMENDENKSELEHYYLKDLGGNKILTLTDTVFYYSQLPNEKQERKAYEAYICSAPSLGLKAIMPFNKIMNYPKQRILDLKNIGFFSDFEFTEERFTQFIEKQRPEVITNRLEEIEMTNARRIKNYELTEEMFEPLMERKPSKINVFINIKNAGSFVIQEGTDIIIGEINLKEKGSNNYAYEITNHNDTVIAQVNIFQTPVTEMGVSKYRYNVKPFVFGQENSKENYKWFYNLVEKVGSQKSTSFKLERIANYLISEGLL